MDTHDSDLKEIGRDAGINADASTSLSVAHWGYSNAISSGGHAWLKANVYQPVHDGYIEGWNNASAERISCI